MSYAVVRMAKMKSHDLKGIQFHNQRERDSKTNPDIDKEKTSENYDLIHEKNIDYNEHVKEIIESQKTSTRKTRKDAVLVNEFIITSDKDFFKGLNNVEQEKFFADTLKFFKDRYGSQNIAYGTVHNDEATPHMHLGVVPMREGRLQGKNVFDRKELLYLQEEFPKHMNKQGFDLDRGEQGSTRKHLDTARFKLEKTKEQQEVLIQEIQEIEKEKREIASELKSFKDQKKIIKNIEKSAKGTIFGDKVNVPKNEFDNLIVMAKSSVKERQRLNDFKEESSDEKMEIMKFALESEKELKSLEGKNEKLQRENQALKKEHADIEKVEKENVVYKSILQDENKNFDVSETEFQGRLILYNMENGHEPKTHQEGKKWLDILEANKKSGEIPLSRLESFLERLKDILDRFIGATRKFSMENVRATDEGIRKEAERSKSRKSKSHEMEM